MHPLRLPIAGMRGAALQRDCVSIGGSFTGQIPGHMHGQEGPAPARRLRLSAPELQVETVQLLLAGPALLVHGQQRHRAGTPG